VSDLELLPLATPVADTLAQTGWPAEHPAMREAAPVVGRGHNLVYIAPPAPAWAAPVLAGLVSRLASNRRGPVLGLAPAEAVDEWARVAGRIAHGTGLRLAGAHTPARITRLLRSDTVDLVFLTPQTAHELVRRSALKMDTVDGILFLWPEAWGREDLLPGLLQDAGRDVQRVVVTADHRATLPLIERYCWRAPLFDLVGANDASPPPVRTVSVGWRRRTEAIADLVEQLDPESLAIWAADLGDRDSLTRTLAAAGATATISNVAPDRSSLIIAYDLPSPLRLRELAAQGEVVLLVPPGGEAFAAQLSSRRRPIQLRGQLERSRTELEAARLRVGGVLERGPAAAAFFAVAPLLERHEASAVAAALYELWDSAGTNPAAPPPPAATAGAPSKLWIGIGKRDAVTPHDLVAALVKDAGVAKDAVGKVEIRESFTLVELGAGADPEAVAERLTGKSIRKRRLVARLDKGRQ
jgi:hypothetical protein